MSDAPKDYKALWEQGAKENALQQSETAYKTTEAELLAAYDDTKEDEGQVARSEAADAALQDEWLHLTRIAMTQFPEGTQILGLTPKNRKVAIAACLGWTPTKIQKASGLSIRTVHYWLKERPDIKLFMEEFNLRRGAMDKDILKEKLSELEYMAINCVTKILKDKDSSEGMKRLQLDASKWVFNVTRDREADGTAGVRKILEALAQVTAAAPKPLTPEEEAEIFTKN